MNPMNIKIQLSSTEQTIPDLDYWAMVMLNKSENELNQVYEDFSNSLKGVEFSIYGVAEYICDFFKIESNIKRPEYKQTVNDTLIDPLSVVNVMIDSDNVVNVSLQPSYLALATETHVSLGAKSIIGYSRLLDISFD